MNNYNSITTKNQYQTIQSMNKKSNNFNKKSQNNDKVKDNYYLINKDKN